MCIKGLIENKDCVLLLRTVSAIGDAADLWCVPEEGRVSSDVSSTMQPAAREMPGTHRKPSVCLLHEVRQCPHFSEDCRQIKQ